MTIVYRRLKDSFDPDWHFSQQCDSWPQSDYQEIGFVDPRSGERISGLTNQKGS
jgi:hypothetical protein